MRHLLTALLLLLAGCETARFDLSGKGDDAARYGAMYPYYIETCAVSGVDKHPGFGFEYHSGLGGHAVMFVHGVCRVRNSGFPAVQLCDDASAEVADGVGISANAHFRNAAWIATPGRDFFFDGALRPGEAVNQASYNRTQSRARELGILNNVQFHDEVFEDMPPGMTQDDFKYEASVATDYGIAFGRGRLCARQPVTREQMRRVVGYLNGRNAEYRDGQRMSRMSVMENNCSHFTHNVLAAAGAWDEWPVDRFIAVAALSFPVPKNEFVNQMRRSNDMPLDDPEQLYHDKKAREALLRDDWLPTGPGAITTAEPPRQPNELYDTNVNLIFYDLPFIGAYHRYLGSIAGVPRYTDLADNLAHFAGLYARIKAERKPLSWWLTHAAPPAGTEPSFPEFLDRYYSYIDRMSARTNVSLLALRPPPADARPAEVAEYRPRR